MKPGRLWSHKTPIALCCFVFSAHLLSTPALSQAAAKPGGEAQVLLQEPLYLAQYRECSQRAGPFASQDTAWQKRRDAESRGHPVSNGVVPCYEGSMRGYCFFVFSRC
jgi:hypothetical protein